MKNIISVDILPEKNRYRVTFTDTAVVFPEKTHTRILNGDMLLSFQKQTSLLLWLNRSALSNDDKQTLIRLIDEMIDLENAISFNNGIDAHNG